jgi:hypothetical protein
MFVPRVVEELSERSLQSEAEARSAAHEQTANQVLGKALGRPPAGASEQALSRSIARRAEGNPPKVSLRGRLPGRTGERIRNIGYTAVETERDALYCGCGTLKDEPAPSWVVCSKHLRKDQ